MTRTKEIKILSIEAAMDNLAAVVGIDLENPPLLGIMQNSRLVTDAEAVGPQEIVWLAGEGSEAVLDILDMTYYTIHQHLIALLSSSEVNWDDPKVRKGIQSMLALVEESAHKMDAYLAFRLGKELATKVEERIPYQDLQFFYHHRFSEQLKGGDESWSADWSEQEDAVLFDVTKTGMMDFETVRRDSSYELFSILNENGEPFFNADLLRNIKLVCFDAGKGGLEEDPLLKIRTIEERNLQSASRQILGATETLIEEFFKIYQQVADMALAKYLSQAIIALMMTSNPRNLIQNTLLKSSFLYFHDFQIFLRRAINSDEYQKLIAFMDDKSDKTARFLLYLTHSLCFNFFYRMGGVKEETIGLLHRYMRKGGEINKKSAIKGGTLWSQILIDDENFRGLLAQFPNGPLFKILDQIRETELPTFDPAMQDNLPERVCEVEANGRRIEVIRMACPVRQSLINKVAIVEEWQGLLRSYAMDKPRHKHLLINLQDRTSWQEFARSLSIESLQKNAEFSGQLVVVTFPKSTDFYYQFGEFTNMNGAKEFIAAFQNQLASPEEWGFFFPPALSKKDLEAFFEKTIDFVHREFFGGKAALTRRSREDFIEIVYQLFLLKWIDAVSPDSISFTCKDGIDTGAAQLAMFYSFIKILRGGNLDKEIDTLRYLFYAPALFIRERAIDSERLGRALSALERIDGAIKEDPAIVKRLEDLYHPKFIKSIEIKRL